MVSKKIVVIGGGTGTFQVLTGLKKYDVELSAVISMCDSGGSTGRLRKELGVLPPGDARRAILALSDLPFAQRTLEEVFNFRFEKGHELIGHSVGNILLAALVQITGSMDRAIEAAAKILNASGNVYPVTLDKTDLVAILSDGTRIHGESNIDMRDFKLEYSIKSVFLTPRAKVFIKAFKAIQQADLIILGPGDLYTSIVPTLLVEGVNNAITKSKGKLVYVVNLMTKRGETDGFYASDFVETIKKYLGDSENKLSHIIVNKNRVVSKGKIASWYRYYGSRPVKNNLDDKKLKLMVVSGSFVDTTTFFRHHPAKLAKAIISLL